MTNKKRLISGNLSFIVTFTAMLMLFAAGVYMLCITDFNEAPLSFANILLMLAVLFFAAALFAACHTVMAAAFEQKVFFEGMVVSVYVATMCNIFFSAFNGKAGMETAVFILATIEYIVAIFFWTFFWFYIRKDFPVSRLVKCASLVFISYVTAFSALLLLNHATKWFFYIKDGVIFYTRASAYTTTAAYALWFSLYAVYVFTRKCPNKQKFTLLSYLIFPIVFAVIYVLVMNTPFSELANSATSSCLFFPTCMIFFNIYTTRSQELLIKDKQLTQAQLNSMLLQINPHFIYNTLGSIDSLCRTNPEAARELIAKFSDYLWYNYSDMTRRQMIPFADELKHLKNYLAIETVRFPRLTVEYEINCTDFLLPSLTVQPLAENAVKHGICKRRHSEGTLKIVSLEERDAYIVRVCDDGIGFAPAADDGKPHIGIKNVRERLRLLCGGTLTVQSENDKGTVCEIKIPKEETV